MDKQELEGALFKEARKIIVDTKRYSYSLGDTSYALAEGLIVLEDSEDLGSLLTQEISPQPHPMITDLTGIGVQDLAIIEFILKNYK